MDCLLTMGWGLKMPLRVGWAECTCTVHLCVDESVLGLGRCTVHLELEEIMARRRRAENGGREPDCPGALVPCTRGAREL